MIDGMNNDMATRFNAVVTHRELKDRLISLIQERKSCFAIEGQNREIIMAGLAKKGRKGLNKVSSNGSKLTNVGTQHPISHL